MPKDKQPIAIPETETSAASLAPVDTMLGQLICELRDAGFSDATIAMAMCLKAATYFHHHINQEDQATAVAKFAEAVFMGAETMGKDGTNGGTSHGS